MNIRKLFFAWGITVVTGILTLPVYADLVIADNGSSDFVIEIDPRASAPEQNAARELQTYLQAISGVELPIVSSLPEGKHAIVVGRGERARQLVLIVSSTFLWRVMAKRINYIPLEDANHREKLIYTALLPIMYQLPLPVLSW